MSMPLPDIEAQYPALAELPQKLRQEIAAAAQAVTVPSGTTLFDEQQPCQGFPFVLAGAIRVSKVSASGRELPLYRVTPGETCIITSSCLLGDTPYNARGTTEVKRFWCCCRRVYSSNCLSRPRFATSSSIFSRSAWPT